MTTQSETLLERNLIQLLKRLGYVYFPIKHGSQDVEFETSVGSIQ